MSELRQDELSRRYGGALFDLAKESKELSKVLKEVHRLNLCVREEPLEWAQIVSPSTPLHSQRNIVEKLAASLKLGKLMNHFLMVLCKNSRLKNLTSILDEFFVRVQEAEGILQGTLETPTELSQKEINELQKKLADQLHKKVILNQKIKENLLAGIVLKLGSIMVDTSFRTQLTKLRHVMEG